MHECLCISGYSYVAMCFVCYILRNFEKRLHLGKYHLQDDLCIFYVVVTVPLLIELSSHGYGN